MSWIDASPQWKCLELFAATFDVLVNGTYGCRVLFPIVALDREHRDAAGKLEAFLWMVFLIAGPSFTTMRAFLKNIWGMCTDMGLESQLVTVEDSLPEFMCKLNLSQVGDAAHKTPKRSVVGGGCQYAHGI